MSTFSLRALLLLGCCLISSAARAATDSAARKPAHGTAKTATSADINPATFRSAIVIDAATGKVLFEASADVQNPPASVTKLMTFAVIKDKLQRGEQTLQAPVIVSAEAAKTGGSQAWLVHKETVTVEQLLYLLMVPSANDAATALAIHATGSKEAFVDLMNAKARELGMTHTEFHSPHGLSPGKGQEADVSTARDIALLCRELIAKTDVLHYSATRSYEFRHGNGVLNKFDNHNHYLLGSVPGCDGLKTGYYSKAGWSVAVTAQRNGRRVIAVVLGSPERQLRDNVASRLVERGFAALPPVVPPVASTTAASAPAVPPRVQAAAPTPAPAAAPAQPGDTASSLKLVPLTPEERNQLKGAAPEPDATVHVAIPATKK
jgi:D-alanyl-D-alanine carboxypeptidase (penicillin-binding protein 5/6)